MLGFIARNEKWVFFIGGGCGILLHIFNSEKVYSLFHIANTFLAVFFLLIIWVIVSQNRFIKLIRLASLVSFTSVLIIFGFLPLFQNWGVSINDIPTIIFIESATPPIAAILGLLFIEKAIQKA